MQPSEPSEAVDLDALQRGDASAQERFWRLFWDRVYASCARVLGHGADASDLATDVLHDFLFTYVHSVTHARAVPSYLRLMATRRALRRRRGAERHHAGALDALPDVDAPSADHRAGTELLLPRLADCLETLTPKAQQVLKLRFTGELTTERIGQLVGGSKQYIGKLIRQSTERLRACLEHKRGP